MTRYRHAVLADTHVANHRQHGGATVGGLNLRARLAVDALRRAALIARDRGCTHLTVLGDVFDHPRPSPPVVDAVAEALTTSRSVEVVLLVGNHDLATEGGDHALASLGRVPRVTVVDDAAIVAGMRLVAYRPGDPSEWLPRLAGAAPLLGTHLGVWDYGTPAYLRGARDAVPLALVRRVMREAAVGAALAGNWHQARDWEVPEGRVSLVGATVPVGYGDDVACGHLLVVDADDPRRAPGRVVVPGPRWLRTTVDGPWPHSAHDVGECYLFVRVSAPPDRVVEARARCADLEGRWPGRCTAEVSVDGAAAREGARRASEAARRGDDVDRAVADFVARYPVADPGTREGVASRVDAYRRGALEEDA